MERSRVGTIAGGITGGVARGVKLPLGVALVAAALALSGLAVVLILPAGLWTARAEEPRHFAIKGARVVTVSGAVIEGGTVVVSDGLIAAVGKDAAIPAEAWVIDGAGLTVYPGLIDAATDLGMPAAAPTPGAPAAGAGPPGAAPAAQQARSMGPEDRPATTPWLSAADEIRTTDRRLETWRNAGFTTALSAPGRGIFPGQGAVINLAGERPGQMVVRAPATLQVTFQGAGGIGFPGSLMGTISYIKQVFLDTQHYTTAQAVYDANPRANERLPYDRTVRVISAALRAERPVLMPATTPAQMVRVFNLAEQFGFKVVIVGAQESYKNAELIAAKKTPVILSVKWPEKERDADPDAEELLRVLRHRDRAPTAPAALHKAGVKFAFYNDGITNPKDMLKNVKKSIDGGLPADAAIRAFTLSAAEILGVADRLGSIETGKIANLVVTDGNIFDEKTKVKHVFVDGRRFEVREAERPQERPTVNLTGRWNLTVITPQGEQPATADLSMAADGALTGTVSSQAGTASISKGWVSGNKFNFTFSMSLGGPPQELTMSGTMEGNTIKGTLSVGGQAMEFTGTKPGGTQTETEQGGAR
jgi:imidazolonepropionase-like amidohydrolase